MENRWLDEFFVPSDSIVIDQSCLFLIIHKVMHVDIGMGGQQILNNQNQNSKHS